MNKSIPLLLALGVGLSGGLCTPQSAAERRTPIDESPAHWLREAAARGSGEAEYALGICYAEGRLGISKNPVEAVAWLQKAAAQGEKAAHFSMGLMFDQGVGVTQDQAEAFICFLKAAVDGDAEAQAMVGVRLLHGTGVKPNPREGIDWLNKAADQGIASAQVLLGDAYERGQYVTKDTVKAESWYKQAAGKGNRSAVAWIENHRAREGGRDAVQGLESPVMGKALPSAEGPMVELNEPSAWGKKQYVVKAGDGAAKIAKVNGVRLADLQVANPGADWTKLKVGQIINLAPISEHDSRKPVDTFEISQLEQNPVPRLQARPQYPFALRRNGVPGEVVVDFIIDANGDVQNAYAVRSSRKEFEPAAVQAVTKWKFRPGRKGGRAVAVHMQVPIVFTLNED